MKKSTRSSKPHVSPVTAVKSSAERTENTPVNTRLIGLGLALAVLAGLIYFRNNIFGVSKNKIQKDILPAAIKKVIGNDQTKFSVSSMKDANGIYEFELNLGEGQNARKYTSYITKDGKILFTSGIKIDDLNKQAQAASQPQQKKLTLKDLDKSENPKLTAYVVSNCPFGLQMQRVFKKAVGEAPGMAANLDVKYIGSVENGKITSMHGDQEAQENLKQICIREEQPALYWPYVTCYMKEGKSEECGTTAGVDTVSLKGCMDDSNRGLAYAKKDFDEANKFQISSSPTLLLNNKQTVSEFDFGGRVANSLKTILCGSAGNKLGFCSNDLTKDEVATSFSVDDKTAAQGSTAAQCGTQ